MLDHPNILHHRTANRLGFGPYYSVLEYFDISLLEYLGKNKRLSENKAKSIIY